MPICNNIGDKRAIKPSEIANRSICSEITIHKEFEPGLPDNLYSVINKEENTIIHNDQLGNRDWNYLRASNLVNIILIDDELLARQSSLRLIKKYFNTRSIDVNILEGNDGIECLMLYYQANKNGVTIDIILSDENMNYLNGVETAAILTKISRNKVLLPIPFYILSAQDSMNVYDGVKGTCSKPLNEKKLDCIFRSSNIDKIV
jgi:hypothetical protein